MNPWKINWLLAIKLPWVSITPLGDPVEPDVYCRTASVSGVIFGRRSRSLARLAGSSVATNPMPIKSSCSRSPCSCSTTLPVDNAQRALASTTIDRIREAFRLRRGGNAGTAIAPIARQAKKPTTKSNPGG